MPKPKTPARIPIGGKIKKVRMEKNLPLERIANETGFSVAYLKEVEAGKAIPPVGAILQIARALEIDSASLLKEPESTLEKRIKAHTKRTATYAYSDAHPRGGEQASQGLPGGDRSPTGAQGRRLFP